MEKSIINWELHQMLMSKKKTAVFCIGIGLNQLFPEYITLEFKGSNQIEEIISYSDFLSKYGEHKVNNKKPKP